jgi:invasion protein IalB
MTFSFQSRSRAAATLLLTVLFTPAAVAQELPAAPEPPAAAAPKPRPRKPAPKPAPEKSESARTAWPEGASALSESYGSWTVTCTRAEEKPVCLVTQAQGNARTGKREFVIEIKVPNEGRAEGMILMPFGYVIEPGISFKLDETVLGKGAPYLSCSLEGCLVPISLPTLATDTMKTAKTLSVIGQKQDAKEPTTIPVPLDGFGRAFTRAIAFAS